jgi:hypothetical protein
MLVYQDLPAACCCNGITKVSTTITPIIPIATTMAIIANVVCVAIISAWEIFNVVYGVVEKPLVPMKKRF